MDNFIQDTRMRYSSCRVSKAKLPDYWKRKESGEILPPLAYDLSLKNIIRQDIETKQIRKPDTWVSTFVNREPVSIGEFDVPFYQDFVSSQESLLANKILNKLKGQSAPILMLYRERKETEDLLLSFFSKTRRALKVLRHPTSVFSIYRGHPPRTIRDKRFISRMKRVLKRTKPTATAGDVWLQYRYAWSTTWMDICDAWNALSNSAKKYQSTFVKASLPLRGWESGQKPFGSYRTLIGEATGSFGAHMKVQYRVDDALMSAAAQIQDPITFLYDSIPYSFVLDWAVNISGYLDLQTACAGLVFVGGYTSKFYQFSFKSLSSGPKWDSGSTYEYENLTKNVNISYSRTNFNRTIMTKFPTPQLEFPMKLTVNRINDAVALLRGRMNRSF